MKRPIALDTDHASPKVAKFVKKKLLPFFGSGAVLEKFYLCEPGTGYVEDREGNRWIEANYGAHIICSYFSVGDMEELSKMSDLISVNDAGVRGAEGCRIEVNLWLSARVIK